MYILKNYHCEWVGVVPSTHNIFQVHKDFILHEKFWENIEELHSQTENISDEAETEIIKQEQEKFRFLIESDPKEFNKIYLKFKITSCGGKI